MRTPTRRALFSVSNKAGLIPLARAAISAGYEIVSSGGTAKTLADAGIEATPVSQVTGFPEILDGRVKTLHPLVAGGILGMPGVKKHDAQMKKHGILPFDLVVVNLYPFQQALSTNHVKPQEMVELIDVGGPTLVRAAAKNHQYVTVLVDPADYEEIAGLVVQGKTPDTETRRRLAAKAFAQTAAYDAAIAHWLAGRDKASAFRDLLVVPLSRQSELRYGENHHQAAAFFRDDLGILGSDASVSSGQQLHGKQLSYNNILDADTAIETLKEFQRPGVVIIKHATPSGIALADNLVDAWKDAYNTDTYSPFGGVVAVNRRVDLALAEHLSKVFLEIVVAPAFDPAAMDLLSQKKNLRLLRVDGLDKAHAAGGVQIRSVTGGVLAQERDTRPIMAEEWKVVTAAKPTPAQTASLVFAAKCAKHVRSNAVVFAKGTKTVGIGGGQTARVDAVYIATKKGGQRIKGSVLASDAFFPFRDTVDAAAAAGVKAIVQPGGSIRDDEVIQAADQHGIAMAFSGHRTFKH